MHFVPESITKKRAERLRKALKRHGRDLSHAKCMDLMARLYGYAHFSELKTRLGIGRGARSMGMSTTRREVNPTGRINRPVNFDDADELADDTDPTSAV